MRRLSQIVLASIGLAAVLIIFVHPLMVGPAATPAKAQLALLFLAVLTAIFFFVVVEPERLATLGVDCQPPACEAEERLALICTLIC